MAMNKKAKAAKLHPWRKCPEGKHWRSSTHVKSYPKDGKSVKARRRAGYARGLMQVTDWTVEILEDEKGELRNHLVNVDQKDMTDPNLNIAAGVRWLFRKRETANAKLKRKASWIWTAADYKSYLSEYRKNTRSPVFRVCI